MPGGVARPSARIAGASGTSAPKWTAEHAMAESQRLRSSCSYGRPAAVSSAMSAPSWASPLKTRPHARGRIPQRGPRLAQARDPRRQVDLALDEAELEQHLRVDVGARRLLDGPPQQRGGGLRGPPCRGRRGGRAQGRHDAWVVAGRDQHELRRDPLGGRPGLGEVPGGSGVEQLARGHVHVAVDGLAHERVHEPDGSLGSQDLRPRQRADRAGGAALVDARERGEAR
jgi:hypothetical protein